MDKESGAVDVLSTDEIAAVAQDETHLLQRRGVRADNQAPRGGDRRRGGRDLGAALAVRHPARRPGDRRQSPLLQRFTDFDRVPKSGGEDDVKGVLRLRPGADDAELLLEDPYDFLVAPEDGTYVVFDEGVSIVPLSGCGGG
jgi:hypothetical protein